MSSEDESVIENLAELKKLYLELESCARAPSTTTQLQNHAWEVREKHIRFQIAQQVHQPVLHFLNILHKGIGCATQIIQNAQTLPTMFQHETADFLRISQDEHFVQQLPSQVNAVLHIIKLAAVKPSTMYPRALCGTVPVNPANIHNFEKQHDTIVTSQTLNRTQSATQTMRGAPQSAKQILSNMNITYAETAEPFLTLLQTFQNTRDDILAMQESISAVTELKIAAGELLAAHERAVSCMEQITAGLVGSDAESPLSVSDMVDSRSKHNAHNIVEQVEIAVKLMYSVGAERANINDALKQMGTLETLVADFAKNAHTTLLTAMNSLGKSTDLLNTLSTVLPVLILELRHYFVPSGYSAYWLSTARPTQELMDSLEKLQQLISLKHDDLQQAQPKVKDDDAVRTAQNIAAKSSESAEISKDVQTIVEDMGSGFPTMLVNMLAEELQEMNASLASLTKLADPDADLADEDNASDLTTSTELAATHWRLDDNHRHSTMAIDGEMGPQKEPDRPSKERIFGDASHLLKSLFNG